MPFKKEIEELLDKIKGLGFDRRTIETRLEYSENYIDQLLSKGGNKKFLSRLQKLEKEILQKQGDKGEHNNEDSPGRGLSNSYIEKYLASLERENQFLKEKYDDLKKQNDKVLNEIEVVKSNLIASIQNQASLSTLGELILDGLKALSNNQKQEKNEFVNKADKMKALFHVSDVSDNK